jgi:hypothetical protein
MKVLGFTVFDGTPLREAAVGPSFHTYNSFSKENCPTFLLYKER